MNIDFQNELAWPLKLCYMDKFSDQRVCETYIPGSDHSERLSEVNTVSRIINKQISLSSDVKCELVSTKEYKPQFLKYKNGCFILYNENNCTLMNCKKKIIVNLKEVSLIEYEGSPRFEHIASSFANEKFAQDNVLKESLKLRSTRILNLTMLKNYIVKNKTNVIHGVGCLEDLLPRSFKRRSLQQCTPHPFIIDGMTQKGSDSLLVFRSSIDNIHFPKLVRWHNVFNAVSNFRELHPLRSWVLLGLDYEVN